MKIFAMLAAALCSLFPAAACADAFSDKLEGTWLAVRQFEDRPRTTVTFKGSKVRLENIYTQPVTVEYKVTENNKDGFTVYFEYTHKVKRGNGRIIDSRDIYELFYHEEDGRPILSEQVIEYDGRGLIIMGEYLRKENFTDSFESRLKRELNSKKPVPTVME